MLSILNSQTAIAQDTEQATVEGKIDTLLSLPNLGWARIPSVFPTRKGTANAQEEIAQAQEPVTIALLIAIAAAIAGGATDAGVTKLLDTLYPTHQEEPKVDLSELISTLRKDQAIQPDAAKPQGVGSSIDKFIGDIAAASIPGNDHLHEKMPEREWQQAEIEEVQDHQAIQQHAAKTSRFGDIFRTMLRVSKPGMDFLPYFVPKLQRSNEQAKIEGGLTTKQLQELMELCQEMVALFGLDPKMAKMALPLQG